MKKSITLVLMVSLTSLVLFNGHVFATETHGRIQSSTKESYVFNTTSETKEGVVTLGGRTKNAAERDLVTKIASDFNGVKKVVNNITVEGQASSGNDKIPKPLKELKVIKVEKSLVEE